MKTIKTTYLFTIFLLMISVLFASCTRTKKHPVLRVYFEESPVSTDPAHIRDRFSYNTALQVYEGLYEYHYLKRPYQIVPLLADGMPSISENGRTYIIKIKKGVYFADDPSFKETKGRGREVKAGDFVYSIKRFIDCRHVKDTFVAVMLDQILESFEAIDDHTLRFRLKRRSPYFLGLLTRPNMFVVPKEAVEYYGNDKFAQRPVGTGPYKIAEWTKKKIVFIKNPNYRNETYPIEGEEKDKELGYLKDAGSRIPFVSKVIVYIMPEEQTRWINFINNKIDIVVPDKDSYYDAFPVDGKLSSDLESQGVKAIKRYKLDLKYYVFNTSDKMLGKNEYLRKAISLAYDVKKHNALFFNDQALLANWVIPPDMLGYDANYINPYTRYDLVKAKELLKKAGYPNGEKLPQIRLLVQNTISSRQIGEFFAKNMREIDIDVLVVPVELEELSRIVQSGRGDFHVAKYEHRGYFAEPEDFLKILYGKIDPEYDRMYRKLSSPKNTEKDKKILLNKMRAMAVEKVNIIPLVNPYSFTLVRPKIKNYKPHTLVGKRFKFIKVEE